MSLEQKLDINESKGLLSKITDKIKTSVATRVIAYGLACALAFGLPYDLAKGRSMGKEASKIAFVSNRDGNNEIYVMNADGSKQTRLTNNRADDVDPVWSPDGKKIAFVSNRDKNNEIYVMNADGSNQTRLTNFSAMNNSFWDDSPVWSPDGKKIAFVSTTDRTLSNPDGGGDTSNPEIYVMNADGSAQTMLTKTYLARFYEYVLADDYNPVWSPDGSKIAFTSSRRQGNDEIYVMNADGSAQTRLTDGLNNGEWYISPSWSPDGSKIIFTSSRRSLDGNDEIYVMNADGSNQTRLTNNTDNDAGEPGEPAWSPDGKKIAFTRTQNRRNKFDEIYHEIYVMNADGSKQIRLTNNRARADNFAPVWSPDGKKIAFISHSERIEYYMNAGYMNADIIEQTRIYVMNADGSNQTRLTNNSADNFAPVWSPQ